MQHVFGIQWESPVTSHTSLRDAKAAAAELEQKPYLKVFKNSDFFDDSNGIGHLLTRSMELTSCDDLDYTLILME